jgi:XTP/dITP diphosphohydrolase
VSVAAPREIVLATRSTGKLAELRALFATHGIAVLDLTEAGIAEEPAEDSLEAFGTFEENARAKAAWFAARLPGRVVVADDSGLEVAVLGGRPGVHSKRWSGSTRTGRALDDDNNAALLGALEGARDRRARYVSVVVARDGDREWVARGSVEGGIVEVARGDGGFGYDPLFLSAELGRTFGEVTREEKARVSHRARAFRALLDAWR